MTEVWALPGYDVQRLLGSGATGEVWQARSLASGEPVALKRLHPEVDPAALGDLAAVDSPHLLRVHEVLSVAADTVLVLDLATGGSLAALLGRRGRLDPGEVVTVGAPLAGALAAAHARGLVHGAVSPANVLLTAEGMPLLSDLGLHGSGDAAADVLDLARLCRLLLAGAPEPRSLAAALEAGLHPDPAARPSAAELAGLLRRACPAVPIRLTAVGAAGVPARRRPRRVLAAAGAALLVVAAAAAGWASGRPAPAPAQLAAVVPSPSAAAAVPDWAAVLDRLDAARATAFATADAARLREVYVAGVPALRADTRAIAQLRAAGQSARGVRHAIRHVVQTSYDGSTALLRVVDVLAGYDLVARDRSVLARTAPRAEASYDVELVRTPAGWRLRRLTPA